MHDPEHNPFIKQLHEIPQEIKHQINQMSEAPKQLYWEIQNANNGIVDKLFSKIEEMQAVMANEIAFLQKLLKIKNVFSLEERIANDI